MIDGMEMDVVGDDPRAETWRHARSLLRSRRERGRAPERACVRHGASDGIALAHHLGRALQLTNILRDIDEDAEIGRLYLPKEALRRRGYHRATIRRRVLASPQIGKACAWSVAQAQDHFRQADIIMARNPRAVVKTPRIMGSAYHMILERLIARGLRAPRARVKLSKASASVRRSPAHDFLMVGHVHIIGAGIAGLRCRCALAAALTGACRFTSLHCRPAGAAARITIRARYGDRQRQPSRVCRATPQRWRTSRSRRTRKTQAAGFWRVFRSSISPTANAGYCVPTKE